MGASAEVLLRRLALLADLGGEAAGTVDALLADGLGEALAPGELRTCADAGSPLLVGIRAPGAAELRVTMRRPAGGEGTQRWRRSARGPEGLSGRDETVWLQPSDDAFATIRAVAERRGEAESFREVHHAIGGAARLFSLEQEGEEAAVTWLLSRHARPADLLRRAGWAAQWEAALAVLRRLWTGRALPAFGPWRVAVELGGARDRLRLGTTAWARVPEDERKRKAMLDELDALGTDRRYAEAAYRLVAAGRPRGEAVGRGIELSLSAAGVESVEFFLKAGSA